jgi:hypothetical protein
MINLLGMYQHFAAVRIRYLIVINLLNGRSAYQTAEVLRVHNTTVYRVARRFRDHDVSDAGQAVRHAHPARHPARWVVAYTPCRSSWEARPAPSGHCTGVELASAEGWMSQAVGGRIQPYTQQPQGQRQQEQDGPQVAGWVQQQEH